MIYGESILFVYVEIPLDKSLSKKKFYDSPSCESAARVLS